MKLTDPVDDIVPPENFKDIPPMIIQKKEEYVRNRFRLVDTSHPFSNELIRICISLKVQNQKVS